MALSLTATCTPEKHRMPAEPCSAASEMATHSSAVTPVGLPVLSIHSEQQRSASILQVTGEIDLATADGFENALAEWLARSTGTLVLDLRKVTFIDCQGIAVIVLAARSCARQRRMLHVLPSAAIGLIIDTLGVSSELNPFDRANR